MHVCFSADDRAIATLIKEKKKNISVRSELNLLFAELNFLIILLNMYVWISTLSKYVFHVTKMSILLPFSRK